MTNNFTLVWKGFKEFQNKKFLPWVFCLELLFFFIYFATADLVKTSVCLGSEGTYHNDISLERSMMLTSRCLFGLSKNKGIKYLTRKFCKIVPWNICHNIRNFWERYINVKVIFMSRYLQALFNSSNFNKKYYGQS